MSLSTSRFATRFLLLCGICFVKTTLTIVLCRIFDRYKCCFSRDACKYHVSMSAFSLRRNYIFKRFSASKSYLFSILIKIRPTTHLYPAPAKPNWTNTRALQIPHSLCVFSFNRSISEYERSRVISTKLSRARFINLLRIHKFCYASLDHCVLSTLVPAGL